MSYTKQTWQTGDIVTAEKMNNIENELSEIANGAFDTSFLSDGADAAMADEKGIAVLCINTAGLAYWIGVSELYELMQS